MEIYKKNFACYREFDLDSIYPYNLPTPKTLSKEVSSLKICANVDHLTSPKPV